MKWFSWSLLGVAFEYLAGKGIVQSGGRGLGILYLLRLTPAVNVCLLLRWCMEKRGRSERHGGRDKRWRFGWGIWRRSLGYRLLYLFLYVVRESSSSRLYLKNSFIPSVFRRYTGNKPTPQCSISRRPSLGTRRQIRQNERLLSKTFHALFQGEWKKESKWPTNLHRDSLADKRRGLGNAIVWYGFRRLPVVYM